MGEMRGWEAGQSQEDLIFLWQGVGMLERGEGRGHDGLLQIRR